MRRRFLPLKRRLQPYLAQFSSLRAAIALATAARRSRRRPVWIGDSHAASYLVGGTWANFFVAPNGEIVVRAGARLMYSLAYKGFPTRVERVVRFITRWGRRDCVVPFFVAGEIDVRNSLAGRPHTSMEFVHDYVARVGMIASQLHATHWYVVVPPPPGRSASLDPAYPFQGSDEERLAQFTRLRAALQSATRSVPGVQLVDFTEVLRGDDGMLRSDLTDDGCHTNSTGVIAVQVELLRLTGQD